MFRRLISAFARRRDYRHCVAAMHRVQTLVDGELNRRESKKLANHLEKCAGCGCEAEAVRAMKQAVKRCNCDCASKDMVTRLESYAERLCE